jgi:TPR repeat protein
VRKSFWRTVAILSLSLLALFAGAPAHSFAQESLARAASYSASARVIRLARLGNVRAQSQLGFMYARGLGVPQNYVEAAKWYYRAADRGDGRAQLELGLMYNKGQGVPRDLVLSHMWLNLSASHAVGGNRDYAVRLRDALASKMTEKQLLAAQHLAQSWYRSR